MRVIVTGGSGKAGRHVVPYLLSHGHQILNIDIAPFPDLPDGPDIKSQIFTLKADLTDSGQVFNAFTSAFSFADFATPELQKAEAIIHLAAVPRVLLVPDNETFVQNTSSTYNVIEAACKLGIKKIVIASSETVYGACFGQGDRGTFAQFPLTEDMDVNPEDSYALSKLCGEKVARGFTRRFPGTDIYALRIGNVVEPHEYARDFPGYVENPEVRFRNAWSYIDARDLGQICHLCLKKSGLGFQVFNATNNTITTRESTKEVLEKFGKGVQVVRSLGDREAPLSNGKIREVLGFEDVHDWRKYVQ